MVDVEDAGAAHTHCLECNIPISEGVATVRTARGVFCADCFARLKQQAQQILAAQSDNIDFTRAVTGAVLGGIAGAAVWWGVTIATHVSFGLVAIVIGVAVGKGIVTFTGGKRAQSLQVLSVAVATAAYAVGTYLTKRTFILEYLHQHGKLGDLPLVPTSPSYFFGVVSAGFHLFDLIFLAIVVQQAWKIPAPVRLPG